MNVQTGEIMAMSGLERNFEGKFQPCKNFSYQQELGQLTQTASLLALFERGIDSTYVVHTGVGIWGVDDSWVLRDHNWRRGGYGDLNLARAMETSSNIGIGVPVWKFYKGHEQDFFDDLNKMNFGQPDFINGIEGLKPTAYDSPKDSINPQIASKDNIKKMQVILDHVVSQGLGRKAGSLMIRVAGKPGTSQVGEYDFGEDTFVTEYQLAFCGYFPADKPKYSTIVSINKLGLPASGGGMAGVVFHDIMEWMITQ